MRVKTGVFENFPKKSRMNEKLIGCVQHTKNSLQFTPRSNLYGSLFELCHLHEYHFVMDGAICTFENIHLIHFLKECSILLIVFVQIETVFVRVNGAIVFRKILLIHFLI